MAKLKTFTVELGFYELAVAAPSMKEALERWGLRHNAFHQGFAKVTTDPKIVAATNEQPGLVLRRPIGSKGTFKNIPDKIETPPDKERRRTVRKKRIDQKQVKMAARALRAAEQAHRKRKESLERELSNLRRKIDDEDRDWVKECAKLNDDVAKAKSPR